MALPLRRKLTIISLVIYWPVLFFLSHIPIPQLVREAGVSDKSLHLLVYLVLVFLLWFSAYPDGKVNWRRAAGWAVFAAAVCYGAIDELLQEYVGRSCDIADFLANVAGIIAGLALFTFLTFWPALLVVTGISVFLLTNLARANPADLMPVISTIFYPSAYALFTLLWVRHLRVSLLLKPPQLKWLAAASVLPAAFLLTVKLFSVLLGKSFPLRSVILAALGITGVVAVFYLKAQLGRRPPRNVVTE
ncbi:MAG TPA: VanZ family protein [Sedimentisphaerales bacterium]|nr:VanZ family protein [Sedimentisphaerales bacterium]